MRIFGTLLMLVFGLHFSALAQADKRKKEFNVSSSSLAINGYDPVAYFTQGKAIKGSAANALAFDGLTYYFSSS